MKPAEDYQQQVLYWKGVVQDVQLEADEERVLAQRERELRRAAEAEVARLEGLILAWEGYQEGCHADLLVEARRIRALRGGGE